MQPFPHRVSTVCLALAFTLGLPAAAATEFFVSLSGCDATYDGRSRTTAFATVQRGVDALEPGDTLTILPGEYLGRVRRDDLGSEDAVTTIRAAVPGTVVLRGDVPAPPFRPLEGRRFVYVADFDFEGDVPAVNEQDTLTILQNKPKPVELEFNPGTFHYDRSARKIYISTSDMRPPATHRYTVSVIPTHGLYLLNARHVIVEELAVTGFNALELKHHSERSGGSVWGIFLANGRHCVIRDCRAWLNPCGIGLHSGASESGDNRIERCVAWGNRSAFGGSDAGGLTGLRVRRDVIRDSAAFLNGGYGVNIYGTGTDGGAYGEWQVPGNEPENRSRLVRNLSWGNRAADVKIKTGVKYFHTVEHSVAPGLWSVRPENVTHSIIGERPRDYPPGNIILSNFDDLNPDAEFADPENHDYRLQATSRFRGAVPDGRDAGPVSYQPSIYYVAVDGDDTADGLSVANAWQTPARAVRELKQGDTLYLAPGEYAGGFNLSVQGEADRPIAIRGRGRGAVIIRGGLDVGHSRHLRMERLHFDGDVTARGGRDIVFSHGRFFSSGVGLDVQGVEGLALLHCAFAGFRQAGLKVTASSGITLRGNWFDNSRGVGVDMTDPFEIDHAGYNGYRHAERSWRSNGERVDSRRQRNEYAAFNAQTDSRRIGDATDGAHLVGPYGRPQGPYRQEPRTTDMRLTLNPALHSVSATTANIEWVTSTPAGCLLAWGETPACENTRWIDVDHFGSFGLTGLEPGKTYYFKIRALRGPSTFRQRIGMHESPEIVATPDAEPLAFTTRMADAPPRRYYVAPDGDDDNSGRDRENAWETLQHAADTVGVGDTVLVAGGPYQETVRMRATGAPQAPITFTCLPGEKVILDGAGQKLSNAFIVNGKSHLRFDGFYFRNYNMFGGGAEFRIFHSRDISVSRCFSDGRGGYSASFLYALETADLVMENCVALNKMGGVFRIDRSPNAIIRHNVFVRPMIGTFSLYNGPGQRVLMQNNIFTDMMQKKAKQNFNFGELEEAATLGLDHNGFFVRSFPPEERNLFSAVDHAERRVTDRYTGADFDDAFGPTGTIFGDPRFAGDPGARDDPEDKRGFSPDRFMDRNLDLDFNAFFATHPDFLQRGIGLHPEAFADFHFNRED